MSELRHARKLSARLIQVSLVNLASRVLDKGSEAGFVRESSMQVRCPTHGIRSGGTCKLGINLGSRLCACKLGFKVTGKVRQYM